MLFRPAGAVSRACLPATLVVIAALGACGGDAATAPDPHPLARVVLTPDSIVLAPSESRRLSVELRDASGAVLPTAPLTWKTSAGVVATVTSDGTVSGVAPGLAMVSASSGAIGDSTVVRVVAVAPVVARVVVTGHADSLLQGEKSQFTAVALDASGNTITGQHATWVGTTVASVDGTGLVTALRDGRAAITATIGEATGQLDVHVIDTVATATMTPASLEFGVGGAVPIDVALLNDRGEKIGVTMIGGSRTVTWASPSLTVASTAPNDAVVTAGPTPVDAIVTATTVLEHKSFTAHIVTRTYAFTGLATGSAHSCGLSASGAPACWGTNGADQLGLLGVASVAAPVTIGGGMSFQYLVAGSRQTCGLTTGGQAYCWGDNGYGTVGPPGGPFLEPVAVPGGYTFTQITAYGNTNCGLTADGVAVCWGYRAQLSDLPGPLVIRSPVLFASLAAGPDHVCGLTAAGAAYCWGENGSGQIGDGTKGNHRDDPVPVSGGIVFAKLFGGIEHTCGITASGAAYCWGGGEIGDGTIYERLVPTLVQAPGVSFTQLAIGTFHICGLASTGTVYCWGYNVDGEVSADPAEDLLLPTPVGLTASAVSAGGWFSCALTADGVYCWGQNTASQLGAGAAGVGLVNTRGRGPIRVAGQ